MIYVINILTPTRQGDAYDLVAINKFPIIYRTSRKPDEFLHDSCMIEQMKSLILNKTTYNHSVLYIRCINNDMTFKDYEYPVKDILKSFEVSDKKQDTKNGKEK